MNKVTKELKKLEKDPLDFATLTVRKTGRFYFQLRDGTNIVDATMLGPEESPYDGGAFHLEISVPNNYPLVAPTVILRRDLIHMQVRFVTKIYHPLVDKDEGKFCNEAIAANWKAVSNLTTVLNTVYEMLQVWMLLSCDYQNYASCEMALDPDIGDEVRNNREAFEKSGLKNMPVDFFVV